ncbi:MAG: pseudouridine synthase [Desulfobacteraceae bacterium 4572_35.1]|nr:MAG: pseudouridine synthase [Desulfobacteraceae bacterium 4572_35.1]
MEQKQRIQKLIAQAGLASRRQAEIWISQGRVTLNANVAKLGDRADLNEDRVCVDGKELTAGQKKVYLLLNKPVGYVTTLSDPQGRPTILHFLTDIDERLFPVGRLDLNTEGLLLLTNDGDLAARLLHPRHKIPKTYRVKVSGQLSSVAQQKLTRGVELEDGLTAPAKIEHLRSSPRNSWFDLTIFEGRNRQVRRMCRAVGYSVSSLKRVRMANIELGNLASGKTRMLRSDELENLKKM